MSDVKYALASLMKDNNDNYKQFTYVCFCIFGSFVLLMFLCLFLILFFSKQQYQPYQQPYKMYQPPYLQYQPYQTSQLPYQPYQQIQQQPEKKQFLLTAVE